MSGCMETDLGAGSVLWGCAFLEWCQQMLMDATVLFFSPQSIPLHDLGKITARDRIERRWRNEGISNLVINQRAFV